MSKAAVERACRMYTEAKLNRNISDKFWIKLKAYFKKNQLKLSFKSIDFYLGQSQKRLVSIPLEDQKRLSDLCAQFQKFRGQDILAIIAQLGSKPERSTISFWFSDIGGFGKDQEYTPEQTFDILCKAIRYKMSKRNSKVSS